MEVVCSYAPSQSDLVAALASSTGGASVTAAAIAKAAGLTAVSHSSGAYIFTGSAGYVAGTLGGAAVGPALLLVGVTVGGASATVEILCAPKNHPGQYAKVEAAASEFYKRAQKAVTTKVGEARPIAAELKASVIKTGSEAVDYAYRKSVELAEALKR